MAWVIADKSLGAHFFASVGPQYDYYSVAGLGHDRISGIILISCDRAIKSSQTNYTWGVNMATVYGETHLECCS